ncbi:MAG TPA: HD domain-containing phosphohydrolase [Bryobacteraceae bacterium]|nr:HD domain-containing phosphohydrolase [Bryobacteraceae bacterium]
MAEKILCVDDEVNILLSLQRQLRKQFHMESALGPEQALAVIERDGPYAVVVSDLQMPGMNGLQLLAKVRELSPETVRIMLTGQADLDTAIAAVNQGNIFRFLTKPCSAEQLAGTIDAALEQHRLLTAERNLLENTLHASVKVLTEVLSLVHPAAFSRASRIHRYVRYMAGALKLRDAWQYEVAALLSQVGCITLEPGALDRIYTGDELSEEEKKMFAAHPAAGGQLLAHIPRLEAVASMIANQNLSFEQSPPVAARVPRDAATTGAHLLRAALDFDRLITRNRSHEETLAQMRLHAHDYDPVCLEALAAYVAPEGGMAVRVLKSAELLPGMVVDQDVRSKTGLLLLAKGQEVTLSVLGRLRAFAAKVGIAEPVRVLVEGEGAPAAGGVD